MILTHIRSSAGNTLNFHGKINPQNNEIEINFADKVEKITLSVEVIRKQYGSGNLCFIVGVNSEDQVIVFVYDLLNASTAINNYREKFNYPRNVILAVIPKEAKSWQDPGVKIITRENTNSLDREYNEVQVFYNEPLDLSDDTQFKSWEGFFMKPGNPWAKGFLFFGGVKVYATEVR